MKGQLRKSGIDIIGDVPWGTHICQFYHTKEDLMEILVTYFKAGLENSEFCLWVTSEPVEVEDAKDTLRKVVPELEAYLEKGQIEIIPYTEWFVTDGVFDSQKVSKNRLEKLNHALEKGYEGMRLSGNTTWLDKNYWGSFIKFKEQTDKCMDTYRMINLCTYPVDRHNAAEIIDVVVNHQFALIKRGENWEKIESPKRKQAEKAAIQAAKNWEYTFDAVPDLIAILDTEYQIVRANKAMAASLGLTPQECKGLKCYQVVHGLNEPPVFCPFRQLLKDGQEHIKEVHEEFLGGDFIVSVSPLYDSEGQASGCIHVARDINERKRVEETLREKEQRTRQTLDKVLSPTREMMDFELAEIIDFESIRPVMEDFSKLTHISIGLVDLECNVLVGAGWKDICTKFHRVDPEACKHCRESDMEFSNALLPGELKLHKCKNNIWIIGTPIIIEGRKMGSIFGGQFFFEDEPPDYEIFRAQARKYGFNEEGYIAALDRVPKLDRELVNKSMGFFIAFASMISQLSYSNFKLAQSLVERDTLVDALRESEERFRSVLENSLDAAYRRDLQNDCYDYMSPVIEKITGFSAQEVNAMSIKGILERIHPDDLQSVIAEMANSFEQGFGILEYRFRCKEGKYCWFADHFTVSKDKKGKKYFRAGIVRDITKRKRAEEALQESEARLKMIIANSPDIIFEQNKDLRYVWVFNPFSPLSVSDVLGKTDEELLPPEEAQLLSSIKNRVLETGLPEQAVLSLTHAGESRWFETIYEPKHDETGQVVGILSYTRDITERKRAEDALVEGEERLRFALETSHTGAWDLDLIDHTAYRSLEHDKIFGYKELLPQWTYEMFLEHVLPEDRAMVNEKFQKAIAAGTNWDFECRIRRVDGEIRWIWAAGKHRIDITGTVHRMAGIVQDITERKEAEARLKEAHDNLEELVKARTLELEEAYNSLKEIETSLSEAQEIAHVGNWNWNTKTGRIYWSDELFRIFGLAPQGSGLSYEEFLNYVHPEDRDYVNNSYKKEIKQRFSNIDFRIISNEGRERIVHGEMEIIFNEKNLPIRMRGVIQDITEQKRAEEKLRESEEKYRNIVETANEIILITNNEEVFTYVNRKITDMLGYLPEEVIGSPIWGFISEEYWPIVKLNLEKRRLGISESYEAKLRRKDSSSVWVLLNAKPLFDREGSYIGAMSMLTDITKRKEAEETLANIETVRKKEIHHRIKNNLQVISSLLDLQVEKFGNKEHFEKSEVLKAFRESQDRVASIALIHEELHEGKGTNTLNFSPYLHRLVENLFQTYTVRNSNISLNMDLEENIFFDMDIAVPLGLIVNEIVSNSLKYAFSGRDNGLIQIKLHRKEEGEFAEEYQDANGVCHKETTNFSLTVSDNGKGLPENFKIENSRSLGLQLITILIDQLEGKLELKGENGTEFIIKFAVPEGE